MKVIRLSIWILAGASAFAQTKAQPSFEAASIKASKDPLGGRHWNSHPGTIELRGQSLKDLVGIAYHLKDGQIAGGPKWFDGDRYDINAKSAGPDDDPELLIMLQTLLAERFHLVFHHETKVATSYALVTVKSGLKIKPAEGATGSRSNSGRGRISAQGVTMAKLSDLLSRTTGTPVTDLTGAAGAYDFQLEWTPEGDAGDVVSGLSAAMQDKLGLKLELRKLPIDLLVIDQAEKPDDN